MKWLEHFFPADPCTWTTSLTEGTAVAMACRPSCRVGSVVSTAAAQHTLESEPVCYPIQLTISSLHAFSPPATSWECITSSPFTKGWRTGLMAPQTAVWPPSLSPLQGGTSTEKRDSCGFGPTVFFHRFSSHANHWIPFCVEEHSRGSQANSLRRWTWKPCVGAHLQAQRAQAEGRGSTVWGLPGLHSEAPSPQN